MSALSIEDMVNEVCRILTIEDDAHAVENVLEYIGDKCGLSGASILESGDLPMMFELTDSWRRDGREKPHELIFDYSDLKAWNLVNPYDEIQSFTEVTSPESLPEDATIKEDMSMLGIQSIIFSSIIRNLDFVGFVVFYKDHPYEWEGWEKKLFAQVSDLLYTSIVRRKKYATHRYLVEESQKLVQHEAQAKTQFLTKVSHELRTPVNAITGMLSIMRHNMDSPEVLAQCLDRMDKASKQMLDLLASCLDNTLIDSGDLTINSSWFSLEELVTEISRLISPLARGRNQQLITDYDGHISVNADKTALTRIFASLLTNAMRFSKEGSEVAFTISYEPIREGRGMFIFRVIDSGMGMDVETLKRITDPISSERAFLGKRSSVGIGLMVTRHLIDRMNGAMDISTKLGEGTEVVVSIELETDASKPQAEEIVQTDSHCDTAELYIGRRILIAEDNLLMAEILATLLGLHGLETDTALNGKEALDAFTSHEPFYYDMIFMDIGMPVMDGLEATRAIRSCETADAGLIPIIALSSNTFEEDKRKSLEAGMNAHLGKPVAERELFETIGQYM